MGGNSSLPDVQLGKEGNVRTVLCVLIACALALAAAPESNVTGKWTGSFKIVEGQSKDSPALLVLKQTGAEITGTVGPNDEEQHTITKGKIEDDKITLE